MEPNLYCIVCGPRIDFNQAYGLGIQENEISLIEVDCVTLLNILTIDLLYFVDRVGVEADKVIHVGDDEMVDKKGANNVGIYCRCVLVIFINFLVD